MSSTGANNNYGSSPLKVRAKIPQQSADKKNSAKTESRGSVGTRRQGKNRVLGRAVGKSQQIQSFGYVKKDQKKYGGKEPSGYFQKKRTAPRDMKENKRGR